jgi:nicotinamidase-related amidase
MTTLENRPNTALLVVDVQNAAVERAHERDAVVANVGGLVERARREGVPVVWVQHSDEVLARGATAGRSSPS